MLDYYHNVEVLIVALFNKHLLHIKDILHEDGGGSGDTSFAWALFYTILILSVAGSIILTLVYRKNASIYTSLFLKNIIRYHIAAVSLAYGIPKLFALQMPFPNLSQLATPLGDFLPMRLSWMFFGYSSCYQIFSGVMETLVGLFLLNRKTVSTGVFLGMGVFANVFLLNISYDIPVKLNSLQLLLSCLFLAGCEWKRLLNFFWFNRQAGPSVIFEWTMERSWQKAVRILFKILFIYLFAIKVLIQSLEVHKETEKSIEFTIQTGIYNIITYSKNSDTSEACIDQMIWKDIIFDKDGSGSVNTLDTLFRQRYNRGYFVYEPDTIARTITFKKYHTDSIALFKLSYNKLNDSIVTLYGKLQSDSIYMKIQRSNRHFQLTEKQFHWISESNR
jgi:hypothetical protein